MSILKRPVVTEKSSQAIAENKYTFEVEAEANKVEIKREVESRFSVNVEKINVINRIGKQRRRGRITGRSSNRRFAVVTLKDGQEIAAVKGMF